MEQPVVYACYNKNIEKRRASSSGGIFVLVASKVINKNGVVYGVSMSKDCYSAEYIAISNLKEISKLQGSKYLQAKVGDTYRKVQLDLENGKIVLFTGTGCQINGLKLFLGKEYQNLICMDVVCHGVPSRKLWENYVKYQESIVKEKIIQVNFRSKEIGWKEFGLKENEKYIPKNEDAYMQMFLKNYSLRPSCYNCSAKNIKMSDFSVADFWGVEEIEPELNDGLGCSLFFIRSEKGKEIFNELNDEINFKQISYKEAVKYNVAEYKSVSKPKERISFYIDLEKISFDELKKKYTDIGKIKAYLSLKRGIKKIYSCCVGGKIKNNAEYGILFVFNK